MNEIQKRIKQTLDKTGIPLKYIPAFVNEENTKITLKLLHGWYKGKTFPQSKNREELIKTLNWLDENYPNATDRKH